MKLIFGKEKNNSEFLEELNSLKSDFYDINNSFNMQSATSINIEFINKIIELKKNHN